MSKKERVKTKLDLLKAFIMTCIAALFGVMSFTAMYYDEISPIKLYLSIGGAVLLILFLVLFLFLFGKEIDKLEKL